MDTAYYMTGTTRCRNFDNAISNVERFRKPAVIRKSGDFYDVTRFATKPVQPGQVPFILDDGEKVHFA